MADVLLPEHLRNPSARHRYYPLVSVDDHLVEPRHLFEGRLPEALADRAPRVVEVPGGEGQLPAESWRYEDQVLTQAGSNAVAGHSRDDVEEFLFEPARYDDMRPGCYDIEARIADMDIAGIYATLAFPSFLTGFCGSVFARSKDQELGLACLRAWNDWMFEEWYGAHPDRVIPLGLTWLPDPVIAAAEIRRNAERGFTAVSLPERPQQLGLPSLHSGFWDPVVAACQETDTTICAHVGSSGGFVFPPEAPQLQLVSTLFSALSLMACAEWLWSGLALRFPDIKIVMAEGGVGWVPMIFDRLDFVKERSTHFGKGKPLPTDVLRRNFYFCTLDDPSTLATAVELVGAEHIMIETDYPHLDSTWPDSQELLHSRFEAIESLTENDIAEMTHRAAARVFRHEVPGDFC
jgi:predicted TIM-barrel fold metal-dependent hydrolase